MGLEYIKIHAFRNNCILYKKEYENLNQCLECEESRYKLKDNNGDDDVSNKRPPAKVLWYMQIIQRFKRLLDNVNATKNIRCLVNEIKYDGKIRHVADSL